jgi:hypothetical protein
LVGSLLVESVTSVELDSPDGDRALRFGCGFLLPRLLDLPGCGVVGAKILPREHVSLSSWLWDPASSEKLNHR